MEYSAQEHVHRFSAWAAGRASSVRNCRFKVATAKEIIEQAELNQYVANPNRLPEPAEMDTQHDAWRLKVIEAANSMGYPFTHGIAAKLINVYFKGALVCAGHHQHPKIQALHPPIDAVLLLALKQNNVGSLKQEWHTAANIRWSKFNANQYQSVISNIRKAIPNQPLWAIEQYWQGYQ